MAFLQYKTETIPGKPLKRKVTQEETRERKKQYEKEWERKFKLVSLPKLMIILDFSWSKNNK
jgi:hypothetical protein